MRQIPYKGTNVDLQGEYNTNNSKQHVTNKPEQTSVRINVDKITLISYDNANNILIKNTLTHEQTSRR